MNARQKRFNAVVLHVRNFGEAHRLIEVLTADEGRVVAVARHARASKRRFAGVLDLFADVELELTPTKELWRLEAARLLQPRLGLRRDLGRLTRAGVCCEAVRLLVAEHQAAPGIYTALVQALDCLDAGNLLSAASFFPQLLTASGISPDFEVCVSCGESPRRGVGFDVKRGGVVCDSCAPQLRQLHPGVVAAFTGTACKDDQSAEAVVACAVDWIEAQTGRAFATRRVGLDLGIG